VQAASTPYHCEVAKKTGGNTFPGKPTGFLADRTWEKRCKQPAHRTTVKSRRKQAATPLQVNPLSSCRSHMEETVQAASPPRHQPPPTLPNEVISGANHSRRRPYAQPSHGSHHSQEWTKDGLWSSPRTGESRSKAPTKSEAQAQQTTHHTQHTTHHTPRATHHTSRTTPRTSHNTPHITHHTPHSTHHTPHTTHHTPHTTHHTPHTTPHTSHLTPHTTHHTPHTTPHTTLRTPHTTHLTPHASHHAPHTTLHTTHHTPHTTLHTPHTTHHTPHTTHLTTHHSPHSAHHTPRITWRNGRANKVGTAAAGRGG
jgi:hypothetical protein